MAYAKALQGFDTNAQNTVQQTKNPEMGDGTSLTADGDLFRPSFQENPCPTGGGKLRSRNFKKDQRPERFTQPHRRLYEVSPF